MADLALPAGFAATIGRVFGDVGRAWLQRLPGLVVACRQRWSLRACEPSPHMSLNYLELAETADGRPVALKVGVPHAELFTEMTALRAFAGRGAVELIDADAELGALLLARLRPGTMLHELGDDERATDIAAEVMKTLAGPAEPGLDLPRFGDWLSRALRLTREAWDPTGQMPRDLLDSAEAAYDALSAGAPDMLLHGDLHHENMLHDEQVGWLAIDPKGAVGPAVMEVGRYLHNQLPPVGWQPVIARRVEQFAAVLGHAATDIAAAGLVDGVLSLCWCFEDESLPADWEQALEVRRYLAALSASTPGSRLP